MLYRRGRVWWFEFTIAGRRYRETTHTTSRALAASVERKVRREIEESINGIRPRMLPPLFSDAAGDYLVRKKPSWAPKTYVIETTNLEHLKPHLGRMLVTDITDRDIAAYQQARQDANAAHKTINNEVGTLRAILRRHRLWAQLAPDVRMLPVRTDVGVALTPEQEERLVRACAASRSRSLLPAFMLGIHTGLRNQELRFLRWRRVDLLAKAITVGKAKTPSGDGRVIPLNQTAARVLSTWAQQFPGRRPEHYVFPRERVGFSGTDEISQVYGTDPTTPIGSWKVAWTSARSVAGVQCRFHDLRHTCITRLLERGVPLPVVASLMGWSPATTARMAKRYAHFGDSAHRRAMETLDPPTAPTSAESDKQETVQ